MKEMLTGPIWILWSIAALLAIFSVILLSGHGANLVAGYNTSSKEEREKCNEKRLCRVVGSGLGIIALLLFAMALFIDFLPAWFIYIMLAIVLSDAVVMIVLANTWCKK